MSGGTSDPLGSLVAGTVTLLTVYGLGQMVLGGGVAILAGLLLTPVALAGLVAIVAALAKIGKGSVGVEGE